MNLLSIAINWLATHLVLLSLLGFLFAGLFVSGAFDAPERREGRKTASAPRTDIAVDRKPVSDRQQVVERMPDRPPQHQTGTGSSLGSGAADAVLRPREPDRKAPKLIGGSLPLYAPPRPVPPVDGRPPADEADSFRPAVVQGAAEKSAATRDDLLQAARRAFWNGDFEAAEAAYMALITAYPADADAFGELGNLYQSMGKPQLARDAYYAAAARLREAGEDEKLKEVIELLTREGDRRADQFGP
jgi:TolA-binding protein